ncbi:hypothetical protein D1871_13055 [Nakamurella silvestris]|nr:hypothetical protein D1871_13055 [Nakamurella silvestris]
MIVDCDSCAVRGPACGGCVMTVLMSHDSISRTRAGTGLPPGRVAGGPEQPAADFRADHIHTDPLDADHIHEDTISPWPVGVEWDEAEQTALAVLADSGLVPPLRLVDSSGAAGSDYRPRLPLTVRRRMTS